MLCLGKKPSTHDARDLQFAHYRSGALPAHPKTFGHDSFIGRDAWLMLGNGPDDSVQPGFEGAGDCVFASAAHQAMLWNNEAGAKIEFTGANAIADYSAVTGYRVGDEATDNGTDMRDALKYRQNTGVADATGNRHKIGPYVALEPGDFGMLEEALYLFGIVDIGVAFPSTAMDQFDRGKVWSVVHGARREGGHCIPLVAMRSNLVCVTWGREQEMTLGFYEKYCDEAYAILSPEMLVDGKSIEGFDLAQLQEDLAAVKGRA